MLARKWQCFLFLHFILEIISFAMKEIIATLMKIFTTRSSACQGKSQADPRLSANDSKNGENVETLTCNANSLMPISSKLSDSLETIYLKDK